MIVNTVVKPVGIPESVGGMLESTGVLASFFGVDPSTGGVEESIFVPLSLPPVAESGDDIEPSVPGFVPASSSIAAAVELSPLHAANVSGASAARTTEAKRRTELRIGGI
jgi:hypothetical protein